MLISRWPMQATEVRDISYPEREPRRAIATRDRDAGGPLRVIATHLGLELRERRSQAERAARADRGDATEPTVVLGDFNDWFWAGSVRKALSRALPGRTQHRTFPSICPLLRLDRIYCRPREALLRELDRPRRRAHISDHLPVIADVQVPTKTKGPSPAAAAAGPFSHRCLTIVRRRGPRRSSACPARR